MLLELMQYYLKRNLLCYLNGKMNIIKNWRYKKRNIIKTLYDISKFKRRQKGPIHYKHKKKLNNNTKLIRPFYNRITEHRSKNTKGNSLWNVKMLFRMPYAG